MSAVDRPADTRGLIPRLKVFIEDRRTEYFIIAVIVVNAIVIGLETSPTVMGVAAGLLHTLDTAALGIFIVEIGIKLVVYRWSFFRRP